MYVLGSRFWEQGGRNPESTTVMGNSSTSVVAHAWKSSIAMDSAARFRDAHVVLCRRGAMHRVEQRIDHCSRPVVVMLYYPW